MKYKEEIINDIGEIEPGDEIRWYGSLPPVDFTAKGTQDGAIITRHSDLIGECYYHYRACCKLVPVEPRVFWIRLNKSIVSGNEYYDGYDYKPTDGSKWIKVAECLDE